MVKPTLLPDPTCWHLQLLDASDTAITAVVTTTAVMAACPLCQRRSAPIHSRYVRQVADLPGWAARFAWNYMCAAFSVPTWSVPAVSSRNGCRVRWLPTPGARGGSRMS